MFVLALKGRENEGLYSVDNEDGDRVLYLFKEEDDAEQKAQKKIQEQEIAKKRDEKYLATDDQEVNLDDL